MKKVMAAVLVGISFMSTVEAFPGEFANEKECSNEVIAQSKRELKNFTYSLEYVPDATDANGEPITNAFRFTVNNLPDNHYIKLHKNEYQETTVIFTTILTGDVYTLEIFNKNCSTVIKKEQIRLPLYKTYCELENNCEENPWFDGTYESNGETSRSEEKNKLSFKTLVGGIIIFLIVLVFFIIILLKRRNRNDKIL